MTKKKDEELIDDMLRAHERAAPGTAQAEHRVLRAYDALKEALRSRSSAERWLAVLAVSALAVQHLRAEGKVPGGSKKK